MITGHLKNVTIAVHALSVCLNINGWEMMIHFAFLAGAGVKVANELGAGNGTIAKFATQVSVAQSMMIGVFLCVVIMVLPSKIAYIFTTSDEVVAAVNTLSYLLVISILLNSVQPVLSESLKMEFPKLSLAPARLVVDKVSNSSSSESETSSARKRKLFSDQSPIQYVVDLHAEQPLTFDWEQCLDLESGKMYYLNRKTLKKTASLPEENQKINLELNISRSTISSSSEKSGNGGNNNPFENSKKLHHFSSPNNTVALACFNCHLLVILSKASPSCPNCKYHHSLPSHQNPPPKLSATKSLHTLSLLN